MTLSLIALMSRLKVPLTRETDLILAYLGDDPVLNAETELRPERSLSQTSLKRTSPSVHRRSVAAAVWLCLMMSDLLARQVQVEGIDEAKLPCDVASDPDGDHFPSSLLAVPSI